MTVDISSYFPSQLDFKLIRLTITYNFQSHPVNCVFNEALMRLSFPSLSATRYWLCLCCDRLSTEHLLHRDLGLGTLLPVSVLSA